MDWPQHRASWRWPMNGPVWVTDSPPVVPNKPQYWNTLMNTSHWCSWSWTVTWPKHFTVLRSLFWNQWLHDLCRLVEMTNKTLKFNYVLCLCAFYFLTRGLCHFDTTHTSSVNLLLKAIFKHWYLLLLVTGLYLSHIASCCYSKKFNGYCQQQ